MGYYNHPFDIKFDVSPFDDLIKAAFTRVQDKDLMMKIHQKDYTLWRSDSNNTRNKLGWMDLPQKIEEHILRIEQLTSFVCKENYVHVILLGMGGSSLTSEVLAKTFDKSSGFPDLKVLDSIIPETLNNLEKDLDFSKSLFIVATKSGKTVETISLFKYFYNKVLKTVGLDKVGNNFIAITDPKTYLAKMAIKYKFRDLFINDPTVGGRYSALSFFGLVPAGLMGLDLRKLSSFAKLAESNFSSINRSLEGINCIVDLGIILGVLLANGRDKLTMITSPRLVSFSEWIEQLIAESTGKQGTGLIPIVGELISESEFYGEDRIFVYLRFNNDFNLDNKVSSLKQLGHPVFTFHIVSLYELGAHFFIWQMAVAILGIEIGINPFDQPDVELSKKITNKILEQYKSEGRFPKISNTSNGVVVVNDEKNSILFAKDQLLSFIDSSPKHSYIAIQVYLSASETILKAVDSLRNSIRVYSGLSTTVGYGPRFLHSTGQLHKGGNKNCSVLQIVSDSIEDIDIPDEVGMAKSTISFGVLVNAQALGDRQALLEKGRSVFRIVIEGKISKVLSELTSTI